MKSKLILLLLSLLAIHTAAQSQEFLFAFSWLGGFCNGGCMESKYKLWDHQSFTIHGLWSQKRKQPRIFGSFDISFIASNQTLADKLMNYMPPKSKSHQIQLFLWSHQWAGEKKRDAHGHDYGHYRLAVFKDKYSGLSKDAVNTQIQKDYYNQIVAFYESFPNVRKIKSSRLTSDELASIFKRQISDIEVICMYSDDQSCQITEVRICSIFSKNGITPTACRNANGNPNKSYVLPDWSSTHLDSLPNADSTRVAQIDGELQSFLKKINSDERKAPRVQLESAINVEADQEDEGDEGDEEDSMGEDTGYDGWNPGSSDDEEKSESSTDSSESL